MLCQAPLHCVVTDNALTSAWEKGADMRRAVDVYAEWSRAVLEAMLHQWPPARRAYLHACFSAGDKAAAESLATLRGHAAPGLLPDGIFYSALISAC